MLENFTKELTSYFQNNCQMNFKMSCLENFKIICVLQCKLLEEKPKYPTVTALLIAKAFSSIISKRMPEAFSQKQKKSVDQFPE